MYKCKCLFYCSFCKCDDSGEEGGVTDTQTLKRGRRLFGKKRKRTKKENEQGVQRGNGKKECKMDKQRQNEWKVVKGRMKECLCRSNLPTLI